MTNARCGMTNARCRMTMYLRNGMAFRTYVAFVLGTSQRGSKTTIDQSTGFARFKMASETSTPTDDLASS